MVCFQFSRQFAYKCRPLLGFIIFRRFSSLKFTNQKKPRSKFVSPKLPSKKPDIKKPKLYARDKIRIIYTILKYSPWDSSIEQLDKLDVKWDSYTVTQVLKTHPPMQKAWLFFNWVSGKENFKHDQYTYTTMMDIFGEANRLSSMMNVFNDMKEKKIKIDVVTYTSLINWTSNSGDVDGAMKLWKEMKEKRLSPTVVSYTAYIRILLHHKRVEEAGDVYKEMVRSGIPPNRYTYTVLMEYLASSGKIGEALKIFDQMQETGENPDKAACNSLIDICSGVGEMKAITKILVFMKKNFIVLRYPVYKKALEALQSDGESVALLREVNRHITEEQLHEDIVECDPTPLENMFEIDNGLAWSLLDKQDFIALDIFLAEGMEKNVHLNANLVSKIIEVNTTLQRQNGAMLAYDYSLKLGIDIERAAYLCLLGLSIRSNSFENAVKIVERMIEKGHSLGSQMNCLLIHRFGSMGDAVSATKLFDLLPHEEKSTGEYTALMSALFSSRNANLGVEVFEQMKQDGVDIALGTYHVLIDGLEKCGRLYDIKDYRRESKRCVCLSMEARICNLLFAGEYIFHGRSSVVLT